MWQAQFRFRSSVLLPVFLVSHCISGLQTAGYENRRMDVAPGCRGVCACVTFDTDSQRRESPHLDKPGADERRTMLLPDAPTYEQLGRESGRWRQRRRVADAFPSVTREQAIAVWEYARNRMLEPVA